jgi:hypothetical protein
MQSQSYRMAQITWQIWILNFPHQNINFSSDLDQHFNLISGFSLSLSLSPQSYSSAPLSLLILESHDLPSPTERLQFSRIIYTPTRSIAGLDFL